MYGGKELDELLDKLIRPIEKAYSIIELELLKDIASRLITYDEIGGLLDWRIKRLNDLGAINKQSVELIAELSGQSAEAIKRALERVIGQTLDLDTYNKAYKLGQIVIDPKNISLQRVLQARYYEIDDVVMLIQTNMIGSVTKEYLHIVDKVYLESATGIKSPQQAISDGIMELADKGISGATYMRQGKPYDMAIEPVVRRNVMTTLIQSANKTQETFTEFMGAEYVYVSQHIGARNKGHDYKNHEKWQGKVYKTKDLEKKTGYGKMLGLGGINCRHIHFPYFKGISPPPPPKINTKENARVYELTQKQRKLEREIRKNKKALVVAKTIEDDDAIKKVNARLQRNYKAINKLVKNNKELRRDYSREQIQ